MYKKKSILWFEKAWRNILYLVSRKGKHKVNLLKTGVHSKYQIFKIKDYSTQQLQWLESQESSNQVVQCAHDKFCRKENELQGKTNNFFMGACVCHV